MYYVMWVRNNLFYILDQNRIFCGMYDNFQKALYACQQMNNNLLNGAISPSPFTLPYNGGSMYNYNNYPYMNHTGYNQYGYYMGMQQPQTLLPMQYSTMPTYNNYAYSNNVGMQQPQPIQQPQFNGFENLMQQPQPMQQTQPMQQPQPMQKPDTMPMQQPDTMPMQQPINSTVAETSFEDKKSILNEDLETKSEELINFDDTTEEWNIDSKKIKNFISKFNKK
ncbi:hypothetical protein [Spiroplasma turonicum]|uniref:Uncharacterized protein n=1 Tax=Spiroplasma turonicum TaxID=216946 RepID=A0A0K1P5M5_9MOLU|nr:hypothetical protein [Spiroplasma turonicum]AKU79608.1 hypothetical protein STURON_00362 [Spiroplasma turonicum]ALX70630.1 hypothetical protein STURO_v1c03620 [Spiroplasma turonicum]